jgi:hypothetical protein
MFNDYNTILETLKFLKETIPSITNIRYKQNSIHVDVFVIIEYNLYKKEDHYIYKTIYNFLYGDMRNVWKKRNYT